MPPPIFDFFGHPAGPFVSRADSLHFLRPLALRWNVFGEVTVSLPSVRVDSLFSMSSVIDAFFGFFFVPAFFGVILTFMDCAGVCAIAAVVKAMAVSAANATIRYLRKRDPPTRVD